MPDFHDMHVALCREKRTPKRTPFARRRMANRHLGPIGSCTGRRLAYARAWRAQVASRALSGADYSALSTCIGSTPKARLVGG